MRILIKLSFFLILVTGMFACKQEPKRFVFQPNTADYFSYKNNAVWIYTTSDNSKKDTVKSSDYAAGMADRTEGEVQVSSITLSGQHAERVVIRAEAIPTQNIDRIAVLTLRNGIFIPGPILLNLGGTLNVEDENTINTLSNLNVGGKAYTDVIQISLKSHPLYKQLYFAKSIGIVRKVDINNDTFNVTSFIPGN